MQLFQRGEMTTIGMFSTVPYLQEPLDGRSSSAINRNVSNVLDDLTTAFRPTFQMTGRGEGNDLMPPNYGPPRPLLLNGEWVTVAINGWAHPSIAGLTFLTNCLVSIVLLRREMRTPSNVLLVGMAFADTLTAILPTPCFVRFYTLGHYVNWVPYGWCFPYFLLTEYLPTVTHTASVWLTVALAAHRYVFVCRVGSHHRGPTAGAAHRRRTSTMAGGRCFSTVSSTVCVIVLIFAMSFAAHCFRFGEYNYRPAQVTSRLAKSQSPVATTFLSTPANSSLGSGPAANGSFPQQVRRRRPVVIGCRYDFNDFIAQNEDIYLAAYYWARVLVIHLVPSVALVTLNAALVWTMRVADNRRKQLTGSLGGRAAGNPSVAATAGTAAVPDEVAEIHRRRECRRLSESNATTTMMVVVVGLMLAVELPLGVLLVVTIIENSFGIEIVTARTTERAALFVNFFILLSYPLNFFIYCAMSRKFRQNFLRLFGRRCSSSGNEPEATTVGGAVSRRELTEADPHGGSVRRHLQSVRAEAGGERSEPPLNGSRITPSEGLDETVNKIRINEQDRLIVVMNSTL